MRSSYLKALTYANIVARGGAINLVSGGFSQTLVVPLIVVPFRLNIAINSDTKFDNENIRLFDYFSDLLFAAGSLAN